MQQLLKNPWLIFAFLLVIVLRLLSLHNGFFWDTVHFGSAQPDFFYHNHFSELLLPNRLDSGHIPGFALYVAMIWEIFGRNLACTHLAMLPVGIGIVWQLWLLCKKFIAQQYAGWALLLVLIDPSLLSQLTLISPDVMLAFFFLLAVNSILNDWKSWLSISIFFLFAMSMRGMMLSFCLLLFDLFLNMEWKKSYKAVFLNLLKRSLIYLPAALLFAVYYSWHYALKGWIGYHEDSPWGKSFIRVDAVGFAYNIGLLIWRLFDFGRIAVWLVLILLLLFYRRKIFTVKEHKTLFILLALLLLVFPANMLWTTNLVGHRYLIPIYLIVALLTARLLFSEYVSRTLRNALLALWAVVLLSGNFWVYPAQISEGWDATLAHQPYYGLRHEAIEYLDQNDIPLEKVQTFFPNYWSLDQIELNGNKQAFAFYDGKGEYVLSSNIYNLSDELLRELETHYTVLKRFDRRGVFVVIYGKREVTGKT